MLVIFCSDPLQPKQVDEAYAEEAQAVRLINNPVAYRTIDRSGLTG